MPSPTTAIIQKQKHIVLNNVKSYEKL